MAEGNVLCSTCQIDTAEVVCFCDYPLAALCKGQCLQKHRKDPKFHFEMPIYASTYVSRKNFSACQSWLFGLSRAQQALRKNIDTIKTFEGEIKAACEHIEREIAKLKQGYRAAIEELKQTVTGMIEAAIRETTAQAFMSRPHFTCPLSEWIWWGANPANTGDLLLYRFSAQTRERETIGQLISVEVEKFGTFLPELPLHLVYTQKRILEISIPLCSLSILPQVVPSLFQELDNLSASEPQFSSEKRSNPQDFPLISPNQSPQHPNFHQSQRANPLSQSAPGDKVKGFARATASKYQGNLVDGSKVWGAEGGREEKDASGKLGLTGERLGEGRGDSQLRNEEEEKKAQKEDRSQRSMCRQASGELGGESEPVLTAVKGTVGKRTSCVVCQAHYTREDSAYFCPGACRCHRCVIEGTAGEMATCKYCHKALSKQVSLLVNRGYKRCDVCGLVVGIEKLEASAPCTICSRCVIIESERSWIGLKKAKGHCRIHQTNTIDIEKRYYTDLQQKTKFDKWACCPRATSDDRRLDCGHHVCAVHQEHLRFCRTCQIPVNASNPDL